jgi:hypothetical protein
MIRALAALVLVAGCGGGQAQPAATGSTAGFQCKDRVVEYVVAGGFAADKLGITIACTDGGASLVKWRVVDGAEQRAEDALGIGEFEDLWERIESTGWRQLVSCDNPAAAPGDPVYAFHISDHSHEARVTCTGKQLPFPYDRLVNELDLKAAGFD